MIGDKLTVDMKMAKKAGIAGAWVQMGECDVKAIELYPELRPEFVIKNTEELIDIL